MIKKILNKLFSKNQEAISFRETFDLTGLPLVTLYQGENKYNFIFDSGSNDNIIDSNVLDKIEHEKLEYQGTLIGLDGIPSRASMCNIAFSYRNKQYPFEYLIKDMHAPFTTMKRDYGVNLHGVIGSKFFNKFKYVLDFDSLIAYTKR